MRHHKTDPRVEMLLANLDYAFDKPAWHGPNLAASIRGVRARGAARSLHGRRSIWEQVLHAAYWKQRVLNKLVGKQKFPRRGSDWPRMPEPTERNENAWRADVQLLNDVHRALRAAVSVLEPSTLDAKLERLILGAAAHDSYHTGQILLAKRMLRVKTRT